MSVFLAIPNRLPTARLSGCEILEARRLMASAVNLSPHEQLLLELTNRARLNPAEEAAELGVPLNQGLPQGTLSADPREPLAPQQQLQNAASQHASDMLANNYLSHVNQQGQTPNQRAQAAGYPERVGENISWGGSTGNLDPTAEVYRRHRDYFASPTHRANLLAPQHREAGVAVKTGEFSSNRNDYNALMTSLSFSHQDAVYLTGVVYTDQIEEDQFYTVGEGVAGALITAVHQTTGASYSQRSGSSGGYALALPDGVYRVTLSGENIAQSQTVHNVRIADGNVKLDFVAPTPINQNPYAGNDQAIVRAGQAVVIPLLNNDRDSDGQLRRETLEITEPPQHGSISLLSDRGQAIYTPADGFVGADRFRYRVRDDRGAFSNAAIVELTVREVSGSPFTNPNRPEDVTGDGRVSPIDVLYLFNMMNSRPQRNMEDVAGAFPDVNGDGTLSPMDALMVVNVLNSPVAEGEATLSFPSEQEPVMTTAMTQEETQEADTDQGLAVAEPERERRRPAESQPSFQ